MLLTILIVMLVCTSINCVIIYFVDPFPRATKLFTLTFLLFSPITLFYLVPAVFCKWYEHIIECEESVDDITQYLVEVLNTSDYRLESEEDVMKLFHYIQDNADEIEQKYNNVNELLHALAEQEIIVPTENGTYTFQNKN